MQLHISLCCTPFKTNILQNTKHTDAEHFARTLKKVDLKNTLHIGKFELKGQSGVSYSIQYNQTDLDLLNNRHEYTFPILMGELQVSLQLYENISNHYRLFCYTNFNGQSGMTFSMNLTTEKEIDDILFPVRSNNRLILKGIKSGKEWAYGMLILSKQKNENDIFKAIIDNGHKIESVEILLKISKEYVAELPKFKIGNVLKLKTNNLPLEFSIEHQRLPLTLKTN